jgi:hypothetical protein
VEVKMASEYQSRIQIRAYRLISGGETYKVGPLARAAVEFMPSLSSARFVMSDAKLLSQNIIKEEGRLLL